MRTIWAMLTAALICGPCLYARAEETPKKDSPPKKNAYEARFKKLDANKDGKLSLEEFTAEAKKLNAPNRVRMLEEIFKRLDKNKDNSLSFEEFSVDIKRADD